MRRLILSALLLAFAAPLRAQSPGVLTLPASTRALALGNAFVLGTNDSDVIFYNPAFLGAATGISTGVQTFGGAALLLDASGAVEWFGGTAAVGLRAIDAVRIAPALPANGAANGVRAAGGAKLAATAALAHRVGPVRLGATGTLIEERNGAGRGAGFALGLGAGLRVGRLDVGLSVANIGPAPDVPFAPVDLPVQAMLAAALPRTLPLGPLDVAAAAALTWRERGEFGGGGGLEVSYWPVIGRTFYGRIGGRRDAWEDADVHLTLGAGFSGDQISLDYAYETGLDTHRIGLRWRAP